MFKVIMYTSSSEVENVDLNELISDARVINQECGVSGFFLCHINGFVQVLEGQEEVVSGIMNRILKDTRHRDITVKVNEYIEQRLFPNWAMGLITVNDISAFFNEVNDLSNSMEVIYKYRDLVTQPNVLL